MIHVKQTKLYDPGPPVYRGNCVNACIASIFEVPIESLPEFKGTETHVQAWLAFHYPGVVVKRREFEPIDMSDEDTRRAVQSDGVWRAGFWIASVESPRYSEACTFHVSETGTPMPPYWYAPDECPHCGGSGERAGFHAVVAKGGEVVHDPHPEVKGYGWEYNGRLVAQTWFEVSDPARLIPRRLASAHVVC